MTTEAKVLLWCVGAGLTPLVLLLFVNLFGAWRSDRILARRLREDIERRRAEGRQFYDGGLR